MILSLVLSEAKVGFVEYVVENFLRERYTHGHVCES